MVLHSDKRVETTFSRITALMPRRIHAVIERRFKIKAMRFVTAVAFIFANVIISKLGC